MYHNARYSNNEYGTGDVDEIIVIDGFLTADEIVNITYYLKSKWGL